MEVESNLGSGPWCAAILLRAAHGQPMLNMARGPGWEAICTGMPLPDCGKQQISALMSRGADLRKRGHLDTRTVYLDQCFIRSSRAGFVDHAGHELRNPDRPVGVARVSPYLRSSCAVLVRTSQDKVVSRRRLHPGPSSAYGSASAPMHRP